MRTLVIGLGNPILTDDGAGILAARAVYDALADTSDVDITELSVGGLALMEAMIGYDRVILVDAMWTPPDQIGKVVIFNAGQLPDTLNTASSHDTDLPTALRVGRELGARLPEEGHIQIIAITANNVLELGDRPTPAVEAAIPQAVEAVLAALSPASIYGG